MLTLDGVLDALRAERARCGDGAWVRGYALAYEAFPDGGIDGRLIEEAVGGSPALPASSTSTPPWPAGRARAGRRDRGGEFTDASEIVVRDGRPTGELREFAAFFRVADRLPGATARRGCPRGPALGG